MFNQMTFSMLALGVSLSAFMISPCRGAMMIQGLDFLRHDRFNNSVNFVGTGYDWSGVGRSSSNGWGTLVSPNYIVSATHAAPGGTISFFGSNDPNSTPVTRTITGGQQISGSDLWLGRLSAPVTPGLGITSFAVAAAANTNTFLNQTIYTFGLGNGKDSTQTVTFPSEANQRLGRNQIDTTLTNFSDPALGSSAGDVFTFDFDNPGGVGTDESMVQGGDSGAPSFMIIDGKPALIGIHWFLYDKTDFDKSGIGSGDTLVSSFISALNLGMTALNGGVQEDSVSTLTAVPEPSSLVLLGLAIPAVIPMIRRFQNRAARTPARPD